MVSYQDSSLAETEAFILLSDEDMNRLQTLACNLHAAEIQNIRSFTLEVDLSDLVSH